MTIQTFKSTDFDVFTVDGLEERMSAIKTNIHPRLMGYSCLHILWFNL
ncbi:Uncharacterized protein conserved in bacteria [Streptococcus pneumoniae]|nr:Uncharacterized protein conserved in bacteria [Streptococcus pneumoniae]